MKAKASEFIKYIRSKVGNAYLWGGQGETLFGLARLLATEERRAGVDTGSRRA